MTPFFETVSTQKAQVKPIPEGKFGAQLATFENGTKAVIKTVQFSNSFFRGVPREGFHLREVAAYRLSERLGWGVVPETLLITWRGREASCQKFVEGVAPKALVPGLFDRKLDDWKFRFAKFFGKVNTDDLRRIVLLDLLINNTDRHAKNVVIDVAAKRVWGIDNSITFAPYYRNYKDVFHKYLFYTHLDIPQDELSAIGALTVDTLEETLGRFVGTTEIQQTYWRGRFILEHADRLAYKRMSQGAGFKSNNFPSYEKWFHKKLRNSSRELALILSP